MEILKSDFEQKLPFIKKAILEADFIAIDCEFTGLTPPHININNTDDLAQRYSKIRSSVEEFTIVQYGVCTFKRDKETGDFIARPFNFYIFGNDPDNMQSRRVFSVDASSLAFLHSNNFDFNKWIKEGIPFYNFTEEGTFYESAYGTLRMNNRRSRIEESALTQSGKSFLEYNRKAINNWLQGNTEQPLIIQVNTPFYKKLIFQEVQENYNNFLQVMSRDIKHVEIVRLKEEQRKAKLQKTSALNFRTIIEAIGDAKCPVVAHNAAFDILHTTDQFWQYLPDNLTKCKEVVNSMWDYIVDTKYLAEYHPLLRGCFNTSVLGSLFNTVHTELEEAGQKIVLAPGFDRYIKSNKPNEHEAAYDAYMTGVIYLAFMMYINEQSDKQNNKENGEQINKPNGVENGVEDDEENKEQNGEVNGEQKEGDNNKEKGITLLGKRKRDLIDSDDVEDTIETNEEGETTESSEDEEEEKEEGEIESTKVIDEPSRTLFFNKSVIPYYGRIFLMRSDTPYINLKGEEEVNVESRKKSRTD
ncbi:hypothetical protein G6F70_008105 [Rhizopus microsporus]|uniref:Uncharacterized protein n=2 Tax=Rhizopus TaxID=4842 RepID=A0A367JQ26_RHIAZ|nr:hypothetical protein G6F71_008113 [Rhizopus microsporus]RCH91969.1 hypothetical protein CU097_011517 [Rhizopus azygosporus]KAG1195599.1 hypothetical protein G6F70_008105 [Rhizopus microsporus]KAG1207435.1 hypothetical protein G6F69_008047 [Rhizopus microsporus]KAG1228196.1 hypothetical protein G6F67_007979 [Rhizopus microsporus]